MRNRISVTALDSYQYFLDSDMSEAELRERLFGDFIPTYAMQAGSAWHKVLELWQGQTANNQYLQGDFIFDLSVLDCGNKPIVLGKPWQREQKHVWQGVDGVDLVGKIDVETPFVIIDHKLSANFDPERYFNSWQWRAYLTMRNKNKFTYQIFECEPIDKIKNNTVQIKHYHTLDMYAYDGMQKEVMDMVADLSNLIHKWRNRNELNII